MKRLTSLLLLCLIASSAMAQAPVKKDLLELLARIPSPPVAVAEAFVKAPPDGGPGSTSCSAGKTFSGIEQEMEEVERAYEAQAKGGMAAAGVPGGMSADMAQKMQDPDFRKKMKSMSKEEKMKMAMEMMKSAPAGKPVEETDPPPVLEALEELRRMNLGTQQAFEEDGAAQREAIRLEEENAAAHEKIGAWEAGEAKKVPRISTGEMSVPDPGKLKVVRLKACDMHIKQANEHLGRFGKLWNAALARTKARFGVFHRKLAAADYAAASKNFATLKTLSDGQMTLLKSVEMLARHSRASYEEAAHWMAIRKNIEQQ